MEPLKRDIVLNIGGASVDAAAFAERDLKLLPKAADVAESAFDTARAVIVAIAPGNIPDMKRSFEGILARAEDHGLAQIILVSSPTDRAQVTAIRSESYAHYKAQIIETGEEIKAAEFIARHKIGEPAKHGFPLKGVEIEPAEIVANFDPEDILLLERAFFDCRKIYLHRQFGGVAALGVYRADAWREEHIVGPCPMPYFIKIASRDDINEERRNYKAYVDHYIPFHLRPNLDVKRCVSGHSKAILVGNFVDDAVPLRKVLKTGGAAGVLFSLFETSLRGFRLQPFVSGQAPSGRVEPFVENRISIPRLEQKSDVIKEAITLGLSTSHREIEERLISAASRLICHKSPYHGDLHQGNIMVRGNDAIVIDFLNTGNGAPLPADPATLEVSLMFDTDDDEKLSDFSTWKELIDDIYPDPFLTLHPPVLFEMRPGKYLWLRKALRELRHILIACERDETAAKIMVATYLMRFARLTKLDILDDNKKLRFRRHAYAIVIAERIARSLSSPTTARP